MDDREKAAEELGVQANYLDWYSFPQTFASTSGPFMRPGGQMATTMRIDAYTDGKSTIFFCGGKRVKRIEDWRHNIKMP